MRTGAVRSAPLWWAMSAVACSDPPSPPPAAAPSPVAAPAAMPTENAPRPTTPAGERAPTVVPSVEGSVPIVIVYDGIGPLHQGFFNTAELVTALSAGLGGCVSDTAEVVVSYDSDQRIGRIVLHTVGDQLRCKPAIADGAVDLAPLQPIGRALAAYRDGVAGQFDLRIGSFRAGIRVIRGPQQCEVWLGGQYPPDGSTFSPCVTLQGRDQCFADDRTEGVTQVRVGDPTAMGWLDGCYR